MRDYLIAQLQPYRRIGSQQEFIKLVHNQVEIPFNQKSGMHAREVIIKRIAYLRALLMPGVQTDAAYAQRQ
jgi:hypothetical protein